MPTRGGHRPLSAMEMYVCVSGVRLCVREGEREGEREGVRESEREDGERSNQTPRPCLKREGQGRGRGEGRAAGVAPERGLWCFEAGQRGGREGWQCLMASRPTLSTLTLYRALYTGRRGRHSAPSCHGGK